MYKVSKRLYLQFTVIYGSRFTHDYPTDELVEAWWQTWAEALAGIDVQHIKGAIDYCKLNLKWAPTLAEFIEICDKQAGVPTPQEAMKLAINRDFRCPLVKSIFDKINSWDMQHDSDKELLKKFKEHHAIQLAIFRENRKKQALLENKGVEHGSETEQRRIIDNDGFRYANMQKVEGNLPH